MGQWFSRTSQRIRRNTPWIFSGIGTIIIGLFFQLFICAQKQDSDLPNGSNQHKTVNEKVPSLYSPIDTLTSTIAVDTVSSTPLLRRKDFEGLADTLTPRSVIEAVRGALPLQRENVARSYDGIKVSWKGAIESMYKLPSLGDTNLVRISLCADTPKCWKRIKFKVNADDNPGLELLREGDSVLVKGEIAGVDYISVVLRNAKISF